VAATSGTVQILMPGSAEAVHDIEGARARCEGGGTREGDDAEGLPGARNANFLNRDVRLEVFAELDRARGVSRGVCGGLSRDDGHVIAGSREFAGNLPRHVFHPASPWREAFDYDCDAQCGKPLAFGKEYPLELALASESAIRKIWRVAAVRCLGRSCGLPPE